MHFYIKMAGVYLVDGVLIFVTSQLFLKLIVISLNYLSESL